MKKKPFAPLANAELTVLEYLWEHSPSTARELREGIYPDQGSSQNGTIQRLLQRLEDKGLVVRESDGPVNLFKPTLTRQAYAGEHLENLASTLTEGSIAPLITHLVEKNKISMEDINRIRAIFDQEDSEEEG